VIDRGRWQLPRRALAVGTGLVSLYLVLITGQQAVQAYRYNQQVDDVHQQIISLRTQNLQLQAELSRGRSDEDVERIAREELGLVKPGDHAIALTWPDGEPTDEIVDPTSRPEPNWRGWLRLFFDVDSVTHAP
jgi:cell division protein FtsL